jgi:membrane-associated phospholipid phosphatase
MVYYSHFIVPPVTIAVLWFLSRTHWVGYMRRFATVLFIGCAMFILLPTAPPWMAAGGQNRLGLELDALPPLSRPTGRGWRHIGLDAFVKAWDHGRDWANQVAAMPSLHSAFAIFVVVFCFQWVKDWRWRALMLLYPLSMAVALMYFAEHYFVDALAGWAIVLFSFWMWDRIEKKWAARKERLAAVGLLEEIEQTYTTAARPDPTDETPGDTAHSLTTAARPDPTDETPGDTAHSLTTAARPDPTDETPGDTAPDAVQSRPR